MPITYKGKTYQPINTGYYIQTKDITSPHFYVDESPNKPFGFSPVSKEEALELLNKRLNWIINRGKDSSETIDNIRKTITDIESQDELYNIPELEITYGTKKEVEGVIADQTDPNNALKKISNNKANNPVYLFQPKTCNLEPRAQKLKNSKIIYCLRVI